MTLWHLEFLHKHRHTAVLFFIASPHGTDSTTFTDYGFTIVIVTSIFLIFLSKETETQRGVNQSRPHKEEEA